MKINILDPSVYNRIAAGEVVENPASVVKELVENSIDAGATAITVYLENAGLKRIEVVDNGVGIAKEELYKTVLPHATSKLREAVDLDTISTLGFRGEALASIAAVSEFTVKSRFQECLDAYSMEVCYGQAAEPIMCTYACGTSVTVAKLFANVPARYKFLKTSKAEESNVTKTVGQLILANPYIAFEYIVDGISSIRFIGDGLLSAIRAVYGGKIADSMIEVQETERNGIRVSGYISHPKLSKPNRSFQNFILNGRVFGDQTVSIMAQNAYEGRLMQRCFPIVVLNILMPFDDVDVNVHPSKREVRFKNPKDVHGAIYRVIQSTLFQEEYQSTQNFCDLLDGESKLATVESLNRPTVSEENPNHWFEHQDRSQSPQLTLREPLTPNEVEYLNEYITADGRIVNPDDDFVMPNSILQRGTVILEKPKELPKIPVLQCELDLQKGKKLSKNRVYRKQPSEKPLENGVKITPRGIGLKQTDGISSAGAAKTDFLRVRGAVDMEAERSIQTEVLKKEGSVRVVGQLFKTYLILEANGKLLIVDQHAAHERLYYDKFMEKYKKKRVEKQMLLVPYTQKMEGADLENIRTVAPQLSELGFELEFGKDDEVILNSVPADLRDLNLNAFFDELMSGNDPYQFKIPTIVRERIMKASCRAAIKAGEELNMLQIQALIKLFKQESTGLCCPHGRPVFVQITRAELEKMFGRRA